jgi:hypothetical protein
MFYIKFYLWVIYIYMIVDIKASPLKTKRYRVVMNNGKAYDFGLKGGQTYIDHKDKVKRLNYWKRHYGNHTEKQLIDNLVPSASLFAALLLWGPTTGLRENIEYLNRLWSKKHNG